MNAFCQSVIKINPISDNFAKLLIGKYFLDNSDGHFWGDVFQIINKEALLPTEDEHHVRRREILKKKSAIEEAPYSGIKSVEASPDLPTRIFLTYRSAIPIF